MVEVTGAADSDSVGKNGPFAFDDTEMQPTATAALRSKANPGGRLWPS